MSIDLLANDDAFAQQLLGFGKLTLMFLHEAEHVERRADACAFAAVDVASKADRFAQQALGAVEMSEVKF